MASLFKLRRCSSAETFNRSYTSSGMFLRVSVVGIVGSNRNGTIMVSVVPSVKVRGEVRANISVKRTFVVRRELPVDAMYPKRYDAP